MHTEAQVYIQIAANFERRNTRSRWAAPSQISTGATVSDFSMLKQIHALLHLSVQIRALLCLTVLYLDLSLQTGIMPPPTSAPVVADGLSVTVTPSCSNHYTAPGPIYCLDQLDLPFSAETASSKCYQYAQPAFSQSKPLHAASARTGLEQLSSTSHWHHARYRTKLQRFTVHPRA